MPVTCFSKRRMGKELIDLNDKNDPCGIFLFMAGIHPALWT